MPSIGVAITTTGDPRLAQTLRSIATQRLEPGDRILVISDGPMTWDVGALVHRFGKQFTFETGEKHPSTEWGHAHVNYLIDKLRDTVDLVTVQDHDDVYAPRAFEAMREQAERNPQHLLMPRVYNHAWGLLPRRPDWDEPLRPDDPENMAIDGHCPWMPGREPVLPHFGLPYNGDQEFVQANRLLFWDRTVWSPAITTITRPLQTLRWKLQATEVRHKSQVESLRTIYNSCVEYMTGDAAGPISLEQHWLWWKSCDPVVHWVWLFQLNGITVGFVRMELRPDDAMWVTYGLLPQYRGMGLGQEMVQFSLLAAQGRTVRGLVKADNKRAIALYRKAGFELTPHESGFGMRLEGTPPFLKGV